MADGGIGKPRRHFAFGGGIGDGASEGARLRVGHQWHGADFAGAVAALAVLLQDRENVAIERGGRDNACDGSVGGCGVVWFFCGDAAQAVAKNRNKLMAERFSRNYGCETGGRGFRFGIHWGAGIVHRARQLRRRRAAICGRRLRLLLFNAAMYTAKGSSTSCATEELFCNDDCVVSKVFADFALRRCFDRLKFNVCGAADMLMTTRSPLRFLDFRR